MTLTAVKNPKALLWMSQLESATVTEHFWKLKWWNVGKPLERATQTLVGASW